MSKKPIDDNAIAFAKWIGEKMNNESWFVYDAKLGKWYIHTIGHVTTEALYDIWKKSEPLNFVSL